MECKLILSCYQATVSYSLNTSMNSRFTGERTMCPMHKHYIINNLVEFHPADSTLKDVNNPQSIINLNSPAGRCLLLLIERKGMIVSQQDFYEIVWESRGMLVTPNTYYQNISILRKGLKKAGFISDIIVTVPRVGLTLSSDTKIIIKDDNPDSVNLVEESAAGGEDYALRPERHTLPIFNNENKDKSHPILLIFVFLFLLIGTGIIIFNEVHVNNFFSNYDLQKTISGCHIYIAQHIKNENEKSQAMRYAETFLSDCQKYPWVYIDKYPRLPRTSVIRCERTMKEPNLCLSDYFIEGR